MEGDSEISFLTDFDFSVSWERTRRTWLLKVLNSCDSKSDVSSVLLLVLEELHIYFEK